MIDSGKYWSQEPDERGMAEKWSKEPVRLRLESARAMLHLHGILTHEENDEISKRLFSVATEKNTNPS